jgi:hypothetical protein
MCVLGEERAKVQGSGKGARGWFPVTQAVVTYDHATHAMQEWGINIDFINPALAPDARVAVELTVPAARALAQALLGVLECAEGLGAAAPSRAS